MSQQNIETAASVRRKELLKQAEREREQVAHRLQRSERHLQQARQFTRKYENITTERAEAQSFWNDFLNVFDQDRRVVGVEFEKPARRTDTGGPGRIDAFWKGVFLAEHKSKGKNLEEALQQADAYELTEEEYPRLTVVCDFATFLIRDNHTGKKHKFALKDLPENLSWFGPLTHDELQILKSQTPVNIHATEIMSELHEELSIAGYNEHELRTLMTRLLFCYFADDSGIWKHGQLDNLLHNTVPLTAGAILTQLFNVLNTPPDKRPTTLDPSLAQFPYVNGGLFEEQLPAISFNQKLLTKLTEASENVDWSKVSPAIFGAMFQGIMNRKQRHDLGAHYTSEENILKVIEPLFLNELYEQISTAQNVKELEKIWHNMSTWKFLDPAAGCGNFLVVSYRELRRAERYLMETMRELGKDDPRTVQRHPWIGGQNFLDTGAATLLSVEQFYAIEIDSWPAQIAQVAMWLTNHLANLEMEEEFGSSQASIPLIQSPHIIVENALRIDWNTVLPASEVTYILGNPPFLGSRVRNTEQRADMKNIWGKANTLDYVTCWFKKAADYSNYSTKIAFVSTNSITQGEQASILWKYLKSKGCSIDFAYRTFPWGNEASGKAAVHVVIVGYFKGRIKRRKLYSYDLDEKIFIGEPVENINAYLIAAPDIEVQSRSIQISPDAPQMCSGNTPRDGGYLSKLSEEEAEYIKNSDNIAAKYLREIYGAKEHVQGTKRWCLWLVDAPPQDIRMSPEINNRVQQVREERRGKSSSKGKAVNTPTLFAQIQQPKNNFVMIPSVSSENREYIPISFYTPEAIVTNAVFYIEDIPLYYFGILISKVFTTWVRNISSKMKSDFQISSNFLYNNFPFSELSLEQIQKMDIIAQKVLDIRGRYSESSLADLYDPLSMPKDLRDAHNELDRLVLSTYGLKSSSSEAEILATLFTRYQELIMAEKQGQK